MMLDYINEAFKSLDLLTEDIFKADSEGIEELSDFVNSSEDEEGKISIIDMDAETEEDLQDSYVGKVIVDCNICHSHIFKDKEDIKIDAEGVVDIEEECPYCGENNGFVIIGEIHEFKPESEEEVIETSEDTVETPVREVEEIEEVTEEPEEVIEESLTEAVTLWDELVKENPELEAANESLEESFKNVSLETEDQIMTMTSEDNGKVTVTTEPVEDSANEGEMITPVSEESQDEIININADSVEEEIPAEEVIEEQPIEDETTDVEIDEVDEESMSGLGESYLKRVYENVDSFKLTSCSTTPTQLVLEGLITFKSGAKKNTGFIFEAKDATRDGKLRFIGENAHLCRGRKAFTLVGSMADKKLMCESFTYNYRAKNSEGKSTRVYGKVNRNK
ncbi:MAG: hypothetical protein J6R47_04430 [Acholeplasmatales bacterium]|nr:hypothetical protein [Acholeplasmatales bacterium]